jgi:predicted permease
MRDVIVQDGDRVVLLLAWSVAVLLLIVGSNVAMLLTTRIVSRQRELALRAALGCGWGRQIRHLMLEAVLIFLAGAVGGLLLTVVSRPALASLLPRRMATQLPMAMIAIDWRVVVFTLTLAVVAGAIFGAVSAWRTARVGAAAALGASSRTAGSVSWRRTSAALIMLELTMASALLGGSAVLHGALVSLEHRDVGFETSHLVTVQFLLAEGRLSTPEVHLQLVEGLESRLKAAPTVESIGSSTVNPLCCGDWSARATPEGAVTRTEDAAVVNWNLVTPSFFQTMGMPIRRGRACSAQDSAGTPPVVIVDERLARRFWPGSDPIGKRVKRGGTDSPYPWMEVVGVVAPIDTDSDVQESWYLPYLQQPGGASTEALHVFARVTNPAAAMPVMRTMVGQVDPGLAIINLRTMDEVKLFALDQQRVGASVAMIFAVAGALLSLSGVYSLVAFVVAGETRDMGIRLALGATPGLVMRQVVMRVARLAGAGAVIGFAVACIAEPRLAAALGGASGTFWPVSGLLAVALIAAAAAAAAIPARRILRLDPRDALSVQ